MAVKYKRVNVRFDSQAALKADAVRAKPSIDILKYLKYLYFTYLIFFVNPKDSFDFWNTIYFDYYYDNSFNGSARLLRVVRYFSYLYIRNFNYLEYTFALTNVNYIMNLMTTSFLNKQLELTKVFFYWKDFYFFYNSYSNIISLFVYNNSNLFASNVFYNFNFLKSLYIRNIIGTINFDSFVFFLVNINFSLINYTIDNLKFLFIVFLRYIFKLFSFFKSKFIKYRFLLLVIFISNIFLYLINLFNTKIFKASYFSLKKSIKAFFLKFFILFLYMYISVVAFVLRLSVPILKIKNLIVFLFTKLDITSKFFVLFTTVNYWLYLNKALDFARKTIYNINFYQSDKEILNQKSFPSLGDLYNKYFDKNSEAFWWVSYDNSIKNISNYNLIIDLSLLKYIRGFYNYRMQDILVFKPIFGYVYNKVKQKDIAKWSRYNYIFILTFIVLLICLY